MILAPAGSRWWPWLTATVRGVAPDRSVRWSLTTAVQGSLLLVSGAEQRHADVKNRGRGGPLDVLARLSLTATVIDGAGRVVTVVGEIDVATAPRLAEYLVQSGDGDVTVDLSGVTLLDSSGMKALHASHQWFKHHGSTLTIRGTPAHLLRVFQIAGFDQVVHLDGDAG